MPCEEAIANVRSGDRNGYRIVLGVVSVPPAYLPQVVATPTEPWPYWRKAGLAIRAGAEPIDVIVPMAWRDRVGIHWGNRAPAVSWLRLARCPRAGVDHWNAYAGGFFLRSPTACVPLTFRAGGRSATVRFGLGRRCDAAG